MGVRWATRGAPAGSEVLVRSQQPQVPSESGAGLGEKAGSSVEGAEVPAGLGSRLGGVGQTPTQALWMPTAGSGGTMNE